MLAVMDNSRTLRAYRARIRVSEVGYGHVEWTSTVSPRAIDPVRTTCPRSDAIDRARWRGASCFGGSSCAVADPGSGTCHCSSLVTAITSMLHCCPLDNSSTTDHHRQSRSHCLGCHLATPRHHPSPPPLPTTLEALTPLPCHRGLQAMPCCHLDDPRSTLS